jgi:hypothetical protein
MHVDDLAISSKLPKDSANSEELKLLEWGLAGGFRGGWRFGCHRLTFVGHARTPGRLTRRRI